jgi:exosortase
MGIVAQKVGAHATWAEPRHFFQVSPCTCGNLLSSIISSRGSVLPRDAVHVDIAPGPGGNRFAWSSLLQMLVAVGLAGWIASDGLIDMASMGWSEPESSHVLLAPLVFVWLAGVRRRRLSQCSFRGRWTGVFIMMAGWVLWRQGYHYQIQSFWHLGAVALVAGSAITFLGKDLFWKFLPAWAALVFLAPMPGRMHLYVAAPLEQVTAIMTQSVAEVLGINSSRSGNQLTVNGVNVCIVEACNGLRIVITLFMACYVFAFTRPLRWWVRMIVLAASPIVAIACNVIRLVPTLWMFGNMSHTAAERFHDLAGWGMLVLAFGLLTGITNLLCWVGVPVYTKQSVSAASTVHARPRSPAAASLLIPAHDPV